MMTMKQNNKSVCYFSKKGKRHALDGIENQDFVYVNTTDQITYAAVADGVTSCVNCKQGAELACEVIFESLEKEFSYLFSLNGKSVAYLVIDRIRSEIKKRTEGTNEDPFSFASTLSFVCIDKHNDVGLSFSVGDSAILAVMNDDKIKRISETKVFAPGICCATMTENAFVYSSAEFFEPSKMDSVFIGTDGAWSVMCQNGRINPTVLNSLKAGDHDSMIRFFESFDIPDDCSFVSLNLVA